MDSGKAGRMRLRLTSPLYVVSAFAIVATLISFAPFFYEVFDLRTLAPDTGFGIVLPFVSLFLIWRQRDQLRGIPITGSWYGLVLVAAGLALRAIGAFSTMSTVVRYGFLLVLYGLVLSFTGPKLFRRLGAPLAILVFMVPLPMYLTGVLTLDLQLISSIIGVWIIRLFGISVFLEGNVVDLGTMQLEVAEACSGLRYLLPLMVLALMVAYLYRGEAWKRFFIFFVSIPITVLMNSLRVGFIGITVEYWGKRMAEGVLHDFEGWLVFMLSLAALLLVAFLLTKVGRRSRWSDAFDLAPAVAAAVPKTPAAQWSIPRSFVVATAIVTAGAIAGLSMPERQSTIPDRKDFAEFPLQVADWGGHRGILDKIYLDALDLSDYLLVDYVRAGGSLPINLYSAYYAEQKGFNRIHSPRNCIPGGGWEITELTQRDIPLGTSGRALPVNRAVIALGDQKELVYYWYQERGRSMTNENVVKWYLFWDSLKRNRTDGALVRIVAPLPRNAAEADVDAELQRFAVSVEPQLSHYIPD
jgi:exosortase D (VPLPA-CTERM-specific)